MLASGAFQIENPDKAADAKATALAAVESVLKTYGAILQQKPDAKAKPLAKHFERVLKLVFPKQPGVDENIRKPIADRAIDEHGGNC